MNKRRRSTLKLCVLLAALLAAAHEPLPVRARRELCPFIKVRCPDAVTSGQPVTFSAEVGGGPLIRPTFKWTVSAGTITSGQGTSSITVDTTGGGVSVVATVEVGGFPANCDTKVSCTTAVAPPFICGLPVDTYGRVSQESEEARLDNFAIALGNESSDALGYIICYGGRRGPRGEAAARCDRARAYLVGVRALDARRIVPLDGGYREQLEVILWIVPPGAAPPQVAPTVDPNEVEFVEPTPSRRRRATRASARRP